MQYFMMNKPPGCITATRDFAGRSTVYDHVPAHFPRLPHVGRLDYNTEGLLLFTDDGRLAQGLLNKDFAGLGDASKVAPIEKVYHVKIKALIQPDEPGMLELARALEYEPGLFTSPARVRLVERRARTTWIEIMINEGRHHQVRKLCERSGYQIRKLRRVQLGPLLLGDLRLRWCRQLTTEEVAALYAAALPADELPSMEPIGALRAQGPSGPSGPGARG